MPVMQDRTTLHVFVDRETADAIDTEARKRGLSRSAYLRMVLIEKHVNAAPALDAEQADHVRALLGGDPR